MRIAALTPRPTVDDIKARQEQNQIGLYQAKSELNDEWLKHNMTTLQHDLTYAAQSGVSVDEVAAAMLNLLTLFVTAMDES